MRAALALTTAFMLAGALPASAARESPPAWAGAADETGRASVAIEPKKPAEETQNAPPPAEAAKAQPEEPAAAPPPAVASRRPKVRMEAPEERSAAAGGSTAMREETVLQQPVAQPRRAEREGFKPGWLGLLGLLGLARVARRRRSPERVRVYDTPG